MVSDARRESNRLAQARYRATEAGRERHRQDQRRWAQKNRHKTQAHDLLRPDQCESCGDIQFCEASHDDYGQPLVVEWLCRPCHMKKDGLA